MINTNTIERFISMAMNESQELKSYFRTIAETALLTRAEEATLAAGIARGEQSAFDHMVRANLRLVAKIAGDYVGLGLPLADLIAEGNTGLMKAAERFDPEQGKFSTYAAFWIKQCIRRALANQTRTVRLPVHAVDKVLRVRRLSASLEEELGREPTLEELAGVTGIDRRKLSLLLDVASVPVSLDAPVGEDSDRETMGDLVADASAARPGENLAQDDLLGRLGDLLEVLDGRERKIISQRFGLDEAQPQTLEEVGQEMGVTRERIRQLQNIALRKMRRALEKLETPGASYFTGGAEPAGAV